MENEILKSVIPCYNGNVKATPGGGFEATFTKGDASTTRKMVSCSHCHKWLVEMHSGTCKDPSQKATAACLCIKFHSMWILSGMDGWMDERMIRWIYIMFCILELLA